MKWFKHLTGSLKNSFVFELIEEFGGDGYLTYFGTLELMSDEFDIFKPGVVTLSIKKITNNLQLSRQKTLKILRFCDQKAIEDPRKKTSFFVSENKTTVTVTCKRLAVLCDDYTKQLLNDYAKSLRSNLEDAGKKLPHIETEQELEVEEDLKEQATPASLHYANQISTNYIERIDHLCEWLEKKHPGYPYKFVQANCKYHPEAIIEVLTAVKKYTENDGLLKDNPWPVSNKIIAKIKGNYHERENTRAHEAIKLELLKCDLPQIKGLFENV